MKSFNPEKLLNEEWTRRQFVQGVVAGSLALFGQPRNRENLAQRVSNASDMQRVFGGLDFSSPYSALPDGINGDAIRSTLYIPSSGMGTFAGGAPVFDDHLTIQGFNNTPVALSPLGPTEVPFDYTRLYGPDVYDDPWRTTGKMPIGSTPQIKKERLLELMRSGKISRQGTLAAFEPLDGSVPDPLRPIDILPILVAGNKVELPTANDYRETVKIISGAVVQLFGPIHKYLGIEESPIQLLTPIDFIPKAEARDFYDQEPYFGQVYGPLFRELLARLNITKTDEDSVNLIYPLTKEYREKYGRQLLPMIITPGMFYNTRNTDGNLVPEASGYGLYYGCAWVTYGLIRNSGNNADAVRKTIWGHEGGHVIGAVHTNEPESPEGVMSKSLGVELAGELDRARDIMGYFASWDEWLNSPYRDLLPGHVKHLFGEKVDSEPNLPSEIYDLEFTTKPVLQNGLVSININPKILFKGAFWTGSTESVVPLRLFINYKQFGYEILIPIDKPNDISSKDINGVSEAFFESKTPQNSLPEGEISIVCGSYNKLPLSDSLEIKSKINTPITFNKVTDNTGISWTVETNEGFSGFKVGIVPLDGQVDRMFIHSLNEHQIVSKISIPKQLPKYRDGKYAIIVRGLNNTSQSNINTIIISVTSGKVSIENIDVKVPEVIKPKNRVFLPSINS